MDDATFQANLQKLSELIHLDPNRIEFEDLRQMLLYALAKKENVVGFMDSDTIVFLVDAIAALGTYTQYSIDAAYGEGHLHSARLDTSIRAMVRSLGVRQKRKTPACFTARLVRPTGWAQSMTIAPYTKFMVSNTAFFNREAILIHPTDSTVTATLHEGYEVFNQVTGISGSYVRYMSDEDEFTVSDDDVRVLLNGAAIQVAKRPIWTFRVESSSPIHVVEDFTTSTGRLELRFGNNNFAFAPKTNDILSISYFVTQGSAGRSVVTMNQDVTCKYGEWSITGSGISNMMAGSNEVPAETYRAIGPMAFSSQNRAIDSNGYKSIPFEFSGVVDCLAVRQADYAPDDIRYANFIRVALLLEDAITEQRWKEFEAYMLENGLATAKYLRQDPVPVVTNIEADIHVQNTALPAVVNDRVNAALQELFAPKRGCIGMTIAKSDIIETMTTATPNINYVTLISPRSDLNTAVKLLKPATASPIAGALGVGAWQFFFAFTPTNFDAAAGECLPYMLEPADSGYVDVAGVKGYRLHLPQWSLKGARVTLYSKRDNAGVVTIRKVYDEVPSDAVFESGLTVDVTSTTMGTVVPALNLVDTSGLYYNQLGTVTLNIYTTDRPMLTYRSGL